MQQTRKICVACNEDGFGPSAFAYYLVRGIIQEWRNTYAKSFDLKITVVNNSAHGFNESIYSSPFFKDVVSPIRLQRDSLIKLEKVNGEVAVAETLRKLLDYEAARGEFLKEVTPYLEGADIAIDIGVPIFTYSAYHLAVPHRITLFDHSWATTLRLISSPEYRDLYRYNRPPTISDYELADVIANQIAEDESLATQVYLFDSYIAPPEFLDHWTAFGGSPTVDVFKGVLGAKNETKSARNLLDGMLADLRQKPLPDDASLVLISPGGTPIWAGLLPTMIDQFIASTEQRHYIPVLSNPVGADKQTTDALKALMRESDKIRWFEFIKGSTQQIIMPAFDLIVTRAGGGTVNDALASQTPIECVEEPQVQIVLIERECVKLGLIHKAVRIEDFQANPVRWIDALYDSRVTKPEFEAKLTALGIRNAAEDSLAANILLLMW
jgi:hypothetical protein